MRTEGSEVVASENTDEPPAVGENNYRLKSIQLVTSLSGEYAYYFSLKDLKREINIPQMCSGLNIKLELAIDYLSSKGPYHQISTLIVLLRANVAVWHVYQPPHAEKKSLEHLSMIPVIINNN